MSGWGGSCVVERSPGRAFDFGSELTPEGVFRLVRLISMLLCPSAQAYRTLAPVYLAWLMDVNSRLQLFVTNWRCEA